MMRPAPSILAMLALIVPADAQTDEIQVYDAAIAKTGTFNLTWHNNYTFSGAGTAAFPHAIVPDHALNGVAEWAYGATSWFELGLYLPLYSIANSGAVRFNGTKLRALFVVPDAEARTFFYGVNFEFSYNEAGWDPRRFTSEIRPIIGWHLGRWDLVFNPILDNSYEGFSRLDFAPATRIAYRMADKLVIAVEEYADLGPLKNFYSGGKQSHQLFAVVDYNGTPVSVEVGLGFGLSSASDNLVAKLILSKDLN